MSRNYIAKRYRIVSNLIASLGNNTGTGYAPAEEAQKPARCALRNARTTCTPALAFTMTCAARPQEASFG